MSPKSSINNFGKFIKEIRMLKGLTLRQADKACNIAYSYIYDMEKGNRPIPTIKILKRLARGYEIPLKNFILKISTFIVEDNK